MPPRSPPRVVGCPFRTSTSGSIKVHRGSIESYLSQADFESLRQWRISLPTPNLSSCACGCAAPTPEPRNYTIWPPLARLGHTSPKTAARYQHVQRERQREVAKALSDLAAGEVPDL